MSFQGIEFTLGMRQMVVNVKHYLLLEEGFQKVTNKTCQNLIKKVFAKENDF